MTYANVNISLLPKFFNVNASDLSPAAISFVKGEAKQSQTI